MKSSGLLLICVLIAALLAQVSIASTALAVSSDKSIYKVGETVEFALPDSLEANSEYFLEISRMGELIHEITITTDYEGKPTGGASWSTTDAEPGTYRYVLKTSSGEELGAGTLGIVGINKEFFAAEEEIVVTGGGAGGEVTAELRSDSSVLATGSASPDDEGEFILSIKIPYDTPNGTYSVVVDVSGVEVVFVISIETTSSTLLTNTELIFDELLNDVSGIDASIVNSLVAKLTNAKMKVAQAEELLAEGRTHVAKNMLRATRNMLVAFIHEVMAQRGKHLDLDTADRLIASAQALILRIDYLASQLSHQQAVETTAETGRKNGGGNENGGELNGRGHGKDKEKHGDGNNGGQKGKKQAGG